ncbi:MAG: hypothetical protein JKY34_03535 [Kordiimonadaceae bacterium]|nr:hypothetical protein [Porticoccaceae bacterium]MBL4836627.1 hypothetical protein [Kordiimonadaceae bacterium]
MKKNAILNALVPLAPLAALVIMPQAALAAAEPAQAYKNAKECRSIGTASTRLACYDSVTDGIIFTMAVRNKAARDAFGIASVKGKKTKSMPAPKSKEVAPVKSVDTNDEAKQVRVSIISTTKLKTGKHIFITSDGQVWRQLSADYVAREKFPYKAILKQGRLGSYSLVSVKYPKTIKVKRAK